MNDNLPKISIVMPVRNAVNTIEKGIKSLIDQNYPNLEFIILDGASNDGTVEIIEKYKDHIFHFESKKDDGQVAAQIEGYKIANGDLISLMCSDDFYEPGILHKIAKAYQENPDCDIFSAKYRVLNEKLEVIKEKNLAQMELSKDKIFDSPCPNSRFMKKTIFEKNGYQMLEDDKERSFISNDFEFLTRCVLNGAKNKAIDEFAYNYICHEGSLTFSSDIKTKIRLVEDKIFIAKRFLNSEEFSLPKSYKNTFTKWLKKYVCELLLLNLKDKNFTEFRKNFSYGIKQNGLFGFCFYLLKTLVRK